MKTRYVLAAISSGTALGMALDRSIKSEQLKNYIIGGIGILIVGTIAVKAYNHFCFCQKNSPQTYRPPKSNCDPY